MSLLFICFSMMSWPISLTQMMSSWASVLRYSIRIGKPSFEEHSVSTNLYSQRYIFLYIFSFVGASPNRDNISPLLFFIFFFSFVTSKHEYIKFPLKNVGFCGCFSWNKNWTIEFSATAFSVNICKSENLYYKYIQHFTTMW